jgi:hypothetical protein
LLLIYRNTGMSKTIIVLLLGATGLFAAEAGKEKTSYTEDFKKDTFGPKALLRTAGGAVLGQITNKPDEWGRGVAGLGKRFASGFATHIVRNTIAYPVAAALHEDLHYHKSTSPNFGPRLEHALVSTVWTQKTTTGQGTVAVGNLTGTVGGALISRLWQPASIRTFSSGFSSAGISLGGQAAVNVVREFWPDKKKTSGQHLRKN